MLNFLADFEPDVGNSTDIKPVDDATPAQVVSAQLATNEWLQELGAPGDEVATELDRSAARKAFGALVAPEVGTNQQEALLTINTPPALLHLTGMLSAYDWEFVAQAKQLRGYVVAKLLDIVEQPRNKTQDQLKALQLLGKVTEVGLFTEKIEVKKTEQSDEELDARIRERLAKAMAMTQPLLDTTVEDVSSTQRDDTGA